MKVFFSHDKNDMIKTLISVFHSQLQSEFCLLSFVQKPLKNDEQLAIGDF